MYQLIASSSSYFGWYKLTRDLRWDSKVSGAALLVRRKYNDRFWTGVVMSAGPSEPTVSL